MTAGTEETPMKNSFYHTGRLVRFVLRRERVMSAVWIVLLSAFSIALAPMLAQMFDAPARQALLVTIDNPAMIAILGPIYGIDNYTAGAMYFNMMIQWLLLTVAVMNIFLVTRHTRNDEEHGRVDMVLALPTGKLSNLSAVMVTALIVNLLVALLSGLGIAAMGVESMGLNGSLLYGAAIGVTGLVFAAIAAVFSQLCVTSRGAIGLSVLTLGVFCLLRGAGDVENEILSYISPLGLAQRTKAYVENNWWPIIVLFMETLAITAAAFVLNHIRDIRQGFIPEKRGKEHASWYLHSPYGLAFKLLLMPFFGWIIGMYVIGISYGAILGTIDTFAETSDFYAMMIGVNPDFSIAEMYVSMVTSIMAFFAVPAVLMMVLKLRSEEKDGHYENVLSRAVSRESYMTSYVILGVLLAVLIQCASALGIYSAAAVILPDSQTLSPGYLLKANLVFVPALWFMLGLTVLLIGTAPKMTPAVWVYYGFSFFVIFLGRLPDFIPEWVQKLTPFGYIPILPVDEIHYGTLMILTGAALIMISLGITAYRRRDIMTA